MMALFRDLRVRVANLAANYMNGWSHHGIAALETLQLQRFGRCERAQRDFDTSATGSSVALAAGDTNVCNVRPVHSTTPVQKKGNRGPTAPLWVQIVSPSRAG